MLILLALLVGSLLVLPVSAAPSSSGTRTVSAAGAAVPSPVASTHGDLIVNATNSPYILSPATTGAGTYFQQGNITVASGGTLLVQSETIDFIQFIGSTGSAANRLSHIYTLEVQGVLQVDNSTITTNASVLNAYAKLDVNVSAGGQATFQQSALLFPGWLSVYGTGSHLAIESSNVSANPGVATVVENSTLQHDDLYGPTISVGGGGQAMLANSSLLQYFKDNTTAWGADSPTITSAAGQVASSTQSPTFSSWNLPADPENLSRASQYRTITGGNLTIVYSSAGASTASSSTFNFGGAFAMGTIGFGTGSGNVVTVELTPAIVSAINTQGVLALLAATGAYGGTSSLSYNVGTTNSATAVNISSVTITLDAARQYNVVVSGAGSVLTAVDSVLDVNWNLTPGTPVSLGTPVPYAWGSNKILLENGASAFLANVSVAGRSGTYWNQSIALPDASSHAYFYRWLDVPVVGAAQLAIPDAPTVAFYAGDSSQLNNHTSAQMNALATIDPDLGAYVNAQVVREGLAQYGATNPSGVAQLLLGTTELDQTNLPVGDFVGDYHVGVHLPGGANTTQWVYVATTPYPLGMSPATPDRSVAVAYTNYAPSLAIGQVSITIDNVSATSATHVLIGQSIAFDLQLVNAGLLPVASYGITMEFTPPGSSVPLLITAPSQGANVPGGGSTWSNFTWVVNETVVGRHGFGEHGLFGFSGQWSGAAGSVGGTGGAPGSIVGPLFTEVNVTIDPALIRLYAIAPSGQYILSNEYAANGSVTFLGSSTAIVNISGVASSGQSYLMASIRVASGPFTTAIVPDPSMTDGTYSLNVSASYNGRTVYYTVPNLFTVGTVTAPTTNWWQQTFLGLEILYWIIIAIAIVAAILGIVLVSRRQARGKLVECGECGNLIPENATICPKCGAEFESNLVRCSRCGSTIPSNSKVCPECAAQLLGGAEEATKDPERQGYADFIERYRAEAKKELGDNYSEGAFWDWWKRQPTYLSFTQWRLQQGQGTRAGMTAPVESTAEPPRSGAPPSGGGMPPRQGGGGGGASAAPGSTPRGAPPPVARPPPPRPAAARPAAPSAAPASNATPPYVEPAPGAAATKPCSNCGREIPPEYLVCPFCSAVTR